MSQMITALSVEEAIQAIEEYPGEPEDFVLRIAQSVIAPLSIGGRQVTGVQMARITDHILRRGWCPNGFIEDGDFRLYSYKEF